MVPRSMLRLLLAVVVAASANVGCSDAPETAKPAAAKPKRLDPAEVRVFSLQVTDTQRDQFGNGKKPATDETIAFWLANSGTAVAGRFRTTADVGRFDEKASRLIQFQDDQGTDLTQPHDGKKVDTFFSDNKPIEIKLGPRKGEGEFLVRGFQIPAEGATSFHIEAELAFTVLRDPKTAEKKAEMSEGTETELGPLKFQIVDPEHPPQQLNSATQHFLQDLDLGNGGNKVTAETHVAFQFEPVEQTVGSVEWLAKDGTVLSKIDGSELGTPFTYFRQRSGPTPSRIRATYYGSTEQVILPMSFDVRLGLR